MKLKNYQAKNDINQILFFYKKLNSAINKKRTEKYCLKLWARFIKARDNHKCVACKSSRRITAHHICRKSFLNEAKFQTGNGITLCQDCHTEAHKGFNGRADLNLPMDEEGGEKIEILTELYGLLLNNAVARDIYYVGFYNLSETVLSKFKMFQGFEWNEKFSGEPLEQAISIWDQTPRSIVKALMEVNGFNEDELLIHIRF